MAVANRSRSYRRVNTILFTPIRRSDLILPFIRGCLEPDRLECLDSIHLVQRASETSLVNRPLCPDIHINARNETERSI